MDHLQCSLNLSLSEQSALALVICFVLQSVSDSLRLYSTFLSCFCFTSLVFSRPLSPITLPHVLFPPVTICVMVSLFTRGFASCSAFVPLVCCLFLSQLECDNFITVIQKVNDTMIICGTNAGSPRCWMLVSVSLEMLGVQNVILQPLHILHFVKSLKID